MRFSRREFVKAAAVGVGVQATLRRLLAQAAGPTRNIVFIMTDQQPVSTLGCYGNPLGPTPNLDRLAATGVRFTNFYIGGFPCSPSRACMFTGRYPHGHGVNTNDVPLAADIPSMGNLLEAAGGSTGYFGKWHLGGNMYRDLNGRGLANGDWYYKRVDDPVDYKYAQAEGGVGEDAPQLGFETWVGGWKQYHEYLRKVGLGDLLDKHPNIGNHNDFPSGPDSTHAYSQLPEEHHMEAFFSREAEAFIRSRQGNDHPFSLVLSFFGPHLPVAPPKPWDERYSLDQCPLPANHVDDLKGKPIRQRTNAQCYVLDRWTDDQYRDYIRRYYGYCAYIDHQIGRVLDALTECGFDDNTIVLFTSDHGDMVGAHGMIYKLCACCYEELWNVPFLMRVPGVTRPGAVTESLGSNVDIMPTLLDLLGLPKDESMHGVSLAPVLRDPTTSVRDRVFAHWCGQSHLTFDGRWKYALHWKPRDIDELYDVQTDPGEMHNLALDPAHADRVKQSQDVLLQWLRDTKHPYVATVEQQAQKTADTRVIDAEPEVAQFKYLGGNEFETEIVWHVRDDMPPEGKYWAFTQFCNRQFAADGDIVFRFTPWPDPPVTEWRAGQDYHIGPVRVQVPAHAGAGTYQVRSGLWDPERKKGPGVLLKGEGNAKVIGDLTIKKDGDTITDITYKAKG
jgi:arylsulfatase A-like enzyme